MQTFVLPDKDRQRIADNLHQFVLSALPGKRLKVTVEEYRKRRSDDQNRFLWGLVYPTILQSGSLEGWTAEDLHEYFLGEVYGWQTIEGFGRKRIKPIRRSSKMTTVEFAEFIAEIQRRMAEFGVFIADPE